MLLQGQAVKELILQNFKYIFFFLFLLVRREVRSFEMKFKSMYIPTASPIFDVELPLRAKIFFVRWSSVLVLNAVGDRAYMIISDNTEIPALGVDLWFFQYISTGIATTVYMPSLEISFHGRQIQGEHLYVKVGSAGASDANSENILTVIYKEET